MRNNFLPCILLLLSGAIYASDGLLEVNVDCRNSLMSGNQNGSSCAAVAPNQCDDSTDCD